MLIANYVRYVDNYIYKIHLLTYVNRIIVPSQS